MPKCRKPAVIEAVPLAVLDEGSGEAEVELTLGDRALPGHARRVLDRQPDEDGDVDRHQRVGDERRLAGVPVTSSGLDVGSGGAGAFDALAADGGLDEALAARRPAAAGAAPTGLAAGVTEAGGGLGDRRLRQGHDRPKVTALG